MSFRLPTFGPAQMVLAVALLLLGLFLYAMAQTAVQAYRLGQREQAVFAQVEQLRRQRAELEGLLAYLKSDEYIEGFARQQFGYVKPGETLVEVIGPEAQKEPRRAGERWWEAAFGISAAEVQSTPVPRP
jgi:cell division protein FtsB